jgi:hypothetical protein
MLFWLEIALATIIGFSAGAVTMGLLMRSVRNVVLEDQIIEALGRALPREPKD